MDPSIDETERGSADLFDHEKIRDHLVLVRGAVARHRRLVVYVIASAMALASAALLSLPRTYHVEAKIFAQKNPVLTVRGDAADAVGPTRGAVEAVRRRDNLVALIQATDLIRHHKEHRAPAQRALDAIRWLARVEEREEDEADAMVERLEKRLVVWTNDGTVSIAIDWPDAQMARRLVDLAQQNLLEARHAQEITALSEALSILRSHAGELSSDVEEAVAALDEIRGGKQGPKAEGSAPAAAAPRAGARAVVRRGGDAPEIAHLQAAIEAKQRALDDLEQLRRHRLMEVQSKLAEQRATLTDNHPAVIDLKQSVVTLSAPSPQVQALRDEIASLRAEHDRERGAHEAPRAGAAAALPPRIPAEILRLDQELREDRDPATVQARASLRDAMDKYAALREKVQAAQIDLETAQAAFKYRYSVLTPAKLPKRPTSPNVPAVLIATFFAAVLGAIVAAVSIDLRSRRLVERWQIRRLLDRPILGEIEVRRLPGHERR